MVDNIFGTDGIRATMGTYPFTPNGLQELGKAIAQWATIKYKKNPSILLGHDTRMSSDFVKSALKSGLLLYPVQIYDGHVLTSPAVSQLITFHDTFDCGIIISASHNPYQDNGIKVIDRHQGKLSLEDELAISNLLHYKTIGYNYDQLGTDLFWQQAEQLYSDHICRFFKTNFLHGRKIVLDCAHGAAYRLAPALFNQFGATTIVLHNKPDGRNINTSCGALHPQSLQKAVIEHQADIGFAFDGDADRVIIVNKAGHIKDGDDILALLLKHPAYQSTSSIVGTIMTNQGFECYVQQHGKKLIRTAVGDKYIAARLFEDNLTLGGEPSGHIIARDYLNTGDGIFIALRVLESIILNDNWALETFHKFPQIIINVPVIQRKDLTIMPFEKHISQCRKELINGRLIIRYSGTEHLLRIMIEDYTYDHAHFLGDRLAQQLSELLN
jgi:phosphoglucosamine mutase